ncbi:MAG: hypothetical protein ACFFDN_01140 [Candidatus Hodarchaeota archaeon]
MKDKEEIITLIVAIIIIICVILAISGISMIIWSIIKRNERFFNILISIIISEGNFQITILAIIYDGIRPNFSSFVSGIVFTIIGLAGTCIFLIKKFPDFSSKLDKQQKLKIIIIIILAFIILLIIGVTLIINAQKDSRDANLLLLASAVAGLESLMKILIGFGFGIRPYFPIFVSGIIMIIIGIAGTIISIIFYKYPEIISRIQSYEYRLPKYKRSSIYRIKRKGITIKKCPACHAPLKKSPPCECEHCGTMLE